MLPISPLHQPQPGEIWQINHDRDATRYVQIVREPQLDRPHICVVMLLSIETAYLSGSDILIPPTISGLDRDLLAETWNVGRISIDCLHSRVGQRLSRQIYDLLLTIGDVECGLSTDIPSVREIRALGLLILPDRLPLQDPLLDKFHRSERELLYSFSPHPLDRVNELVDRVLEVERDLRRQTILSDWFQSRSDLQWQAGSTFVGEAARNENRDAAIAVRNIGTEREIIETIARINTSENAELRSQSIARLGSIGKYNDLAIATLVQLIDNPSDDETLWMAIESLRRVAPNHNRAGIKRWKSIDLGTRVNFVVNIVPKPGDRVGILLQVYPAATTEYLAANLRLIVEDETGQILREVVAGDTDECIQLKLSGKPREIFSVRLELDDRESIEDFVI
jgi:hypothetical protein